MNCFGKVVFSLFLLGQSDAFINRHPSFYLTLKPVPNKVGNSPIVLNFFPSQKLQGNSPVGLRSSRLLASLSEKIGDDSTSFDHGRYFQFKTLLRVGLPSIIAGIAGFLLFPGLCLKLATWVNDAGVFAVLSQDSSQFVQNYLSVAGLLFSILAGQTYYFMYQQQEMVFYALFNEVTEAKSLLEQVALVCQGRTMYRRVLSAIQTYVRDDLKKLNADPAVLLSARPMDDPLETIMYLTSVGIPSTIYETVRSLRQARAGRLGALQRKLPRIHMIMLWLLALIVLVSFPLLGAGTQTLGGYRLLTVEGTLFGVMTTGIVLTLTVVGELWRPAGGAYNVDRVLRVMVRGLEEELEARMGGKEIYAAQNTYPSPAVDAQFIKGANQKIAKASPTESSKPAANKDITSMQQGGDISFPIRRVARWIRNRRRK